MGKRIGDKARSTMRRRTLAKPIPGFVSILGLSLLVGITACSTPAEQAADVGSETDTESGDVLVDGGNGSEDATGDAAPGALEIPEGCNPLAFEHDCLMPFPSNVFLIDDATLPSGKRVAVGAEAFPVTRAGRSVDMLAHHRVDGFSHHMPIIAHFGEVVDTTDLVFHDDDPAPSLLPTHKTIILEVGGGPVAHWAEVDHMKLEDPTDRVFFVRPFDRLKNETRYIVAFQGLENVDGSAIEAPEGFRHVRDGVRGAHPRLDAEIDRYETDIFPHLEAFGLERSNLILAWDFTTQTMEHVTADLLFMREHLLSTYVDQAPVVTVTAVDEDVNEQVARRVRGTITVPLYMEHARVDGLIFRDEEGNAAVNGTVDVPFTVVIPRSVIELEPDALPVRMIQYGHGFFGQRVEVEQSYMRQFTQDVGVVAMAVDWMGMATEDGAKVAEHMASRPEQALRFIDRVHQGLINQLALTEAAKTSFLDLDDLKIDGKLVYDPDEIYYYGISQGHIFGTVALALSPYLERAVVGVGGASYSLMMSRSGSFRTFLQVMLFSFDKVREVQKYVTLAQLVFDRVDPITYAPLLLTSPLDGSPQERRLLMHVGIGDTDVPNVASHLHVRALKIPQLEPVPRELGLIPTVGGPVDGSAMVEIDYGVDPLPDYYARVAPSEEATGVHEAVRRNPRVIEQIDRFLRPGGLIEHTCDGPCDPE